jgi:3-hydroxymyristoyl/3-hydroxydecanoyl-(acyl carrier protein) dehydratase
MFIIFISAFGGGLIRGLVGFIKHQFSYKNVPFKPGYFIGMMTMSGVIGLVSVWAIKGVGFTFEDAFTPALAFIIGYAGGDFIENIYKILIKKSNLFEE